VAIADGTVMVYQWPDPTNLTSHNELRAIKVLNNGECTSLSWNPAFDEPISLVIGCYITSKLREENDDDADKEEFDED
jgi:hypothetical protein